MSRKRVESIPLLHDNHNHVGLYSALAACRDLSGCTAREALDFLEGLPRDRLTVAKGWRTNELALPESDLARLPPVLLITFSLHGFAVSDAGIPYLERAVPEVAARRADQVWCEANVPAIFAAYHELSAVTEPGLVSYIDALLPFGIGSSDEMTVSSASALDVIRTSPAAGRVRSWVPPALYRRLDAAQREAVSGVKLYLDGAIGARSAALRGPWIGPGRALFTYSDAELRDRLAEIASWGSSVAMHAIGELAIEQGLTAVEAVGGAGAGFPVVRLEHTQFISRDQADRAKKLGLTLSMQPNFSSDSRDYADRLPASYLERNNPFRMLIDKALFVPGKDLLFGSDGMPDGIAYAATEALFPVFDVQRLSIDELVAGYGAARGVSGRVDLEIDEEGRRVSVVGVSRD